jgi:hypothetical protein
MKYCQTDLQYVYIESEHVKGNISCGRIFGNDGHLPGSEKIERLSDPRLVSMQGNREGWDRFDHCRGKDKQEEKDQGSVNLVGSHGVWPLGDELHTR